MTDWPDIKQHISDYYIKLYQEHGYSPRSCDYGRPESQQAKFKTLSNVYPLDNSSVLDVGCGFADYADYLSSNYSNIA